MTSPLLRLPSEVREQILVNVVGDSLIHISHSRSGELGHGICQAAKSEQCAYEEAVSGTAEIPSYESPEFYVAPCYERHQDCPIVEGSSWYLHKEEKVDLKVLGVCRQLYEEANQLLWATNTFSFDRSTSFEYFLASLNPAQKRNLTNIHISAEFGGRDESWSDFFYTYQKWGKALKPSSIDMLRGVRTLHLCFRQRYNPLYYPNIYRDQNLANTTQLLKQTFGRDVQPFLRLKALPSKTVTVIVSDSGPNYFSRFGTNFRWTAAKKIEYAEEIRAQLANTDGAEDFKAEEEARKAAKKLERLESAAKAASKAQARVTKAKAEADRLEERTRRATASADAARKTAKRAVEKGGPNANLLEDIYRRATQRVSSLRWSSEYAAGKVARFQAIADKKTAKAERAKARAEGRTVRDAVEDDDEDEEDEDEELEQNLAEDNQEAMEDEDSP